MRKFPSVRILTLLLAAALMGSAAFAQASTETRRLTKELRRLPIGAAPARHVARLVWRLTKLHPEFRLRYYRIGVVRLSNEGGVAEANRVKLALGVYKILTKAGITVDRFGPRRPSQIEITFEETPTPEPTSEPTPSPTP